ncbi:hypothetical protein DA89_3475 [Vibrio cholerae]|nr:hypothetical protein DA89_3475 [Vibrio cholerae]
MLCLSFVVMRCQPLRRALGCFTKGVTNWTNGTYYQGR